ncbi:hypothetical protein AC578_4974 [Pseudocercospora eumusae]|uniref:Uncharacterized protein n=1 Tax=Pseudocercospora eumusae TaxID=321146 RepID=A0A139H947_9PEZI|nr:hypothetical protein AC578_4974 [Pseudocercospora eumusae]
MYIRPIFTLINTAFSCMSVLAEIPESGHAASQAFWNSLEVFRQGNCTDGGLAGAVLRPAARVCYHPLAILYNLFSNPRPYSHGIPSTLGNLDWSDSSERSKHPRETQAISLECYLCHSEVAKDKTLYAPIFRRKLHAVFSPQAGESFGVQPSSGFFPNSSPSSEKTSGVRLAEYPP